MIIRKINIEDMNEKELEAAHSAMSVDRRRRLGRVRNTHERTLSIAGELLARKCVSELTGRPFELVEFGRGDGGKPCCISDPEVEFNISYTGEYAICAASASPVGVAIEKLSRVRVRIARRYCTEEELEYVFGVPKALHEEDIPDGELDGVCHRLVTVWALKKSYFKNLGVGIMGKLKSVSFRFGKNHEIDFSEKGYRFTLDFSIPKYVSAVCETVR